MYSIFSWIITTKYFKEVGPISGYLLRIFVHIIYFVIGLFLIKTVERLAKYLYKNENCINFTGKVTFALVKIFVAELQPLVRTFLYGIYPVSCIYVYLFRLWDVSSQIVAILAKNVQNSVPSEFIVCMETARVKLFLASLFIFFSLKYCWFEVMSSFLSGDVPDLTR